MKTLIFIGRAFVGIVFAALVWALFFREGSREAWRKHKLGRDYEGPLED